MPQYQITPWKFHQELVQARKELYQLGDSTSEQRRHGVELVHAWSLRGHVPHAVESTALLVDAILHHDYKHNSSFSIRATYSAAFSRFVTGFCDIRQDSNHKRNMFEIAREIDMPASFVELRHEATHEELPSLLRVTRMTKVALDWLWQYYWVKIDGPETCGKSINACATLIQDEQLKTILASFLKRRIEEIKMNKPKPLATEPAAQDYSEKLVRACKGDAKNLQILCIILVQEKMMIPSDRDLNDSMAGAFEIWSPLLLLISRHQRQFLRILVSHITSRLIAQTPLEVHLDPFRETLHAWLLYIFTDALWLKSLKRDEWVLREIVVKAAVLEPNYWIVPLAKRLFEEGSLDFKAQWRVHLEMPKE